MFKFRFKKWGLAKNLKTEQEEEIRVQAASGGIPAVSVYYSGRRSNLIIRLEVFDTRQLPVRQNLLGKFTYH